MSRDPRTIAEDAEALRDLVQAVGQYALGDNLSEAILALVRDLAKRVAVLEEADG